jgi:hypothetical protein
MYESELAAPIDRKKRSGFEAAVVLLERVRRLYGEANDPQVGTVSRFPRRHTPSEDP